MKLWIASVLMALVSVLIAFLVLPHKEANGQVVVEAQVDESGEVVNRYTDTSTNVNTNVNVNVNANVNANANVNVNDASPEFNDLSDSIINAILPHLERHASTTSSLQQGKDGISIDTSKDGHATDKTAFQTINIANTDQFDNLMEFDNILHILSNPELVHGDDYIVLKLIVQNGEEWNGQLPSAPHVEDIPLYLNQKAFSLVINNIEAKWKPIQTLARLLESKIGTHSVGCNLYLTPPGAARAFETHMDWMDVVVLQIAGEKDWSVWQEPFVKLLPPDLKRKPTMNELSTRPFENVRLGPGDVLYLPRGTLHNATTPLDSNEMSLHLTFGLQHNVYTILESLLHHALTLFAKDDAKAKKVIVPRGMCRVNDLTLEDMLHIAIGEIMRNTNCGGFGEGHFDARNPHNDAICSLRESIPYHPLVKGSSTNEDIREKVMAGAKAVSLQVSVGRALEFISRATSGKTEGDKLELGSSAFTFVGMRNAGPYDCRYDPKYNKDLGVADRKLIRFAESFASFLKSTEGVVEDVLEILWKDIDRDRQIRWKRQDDKLKM